MGKWRIALIHVDGHILAECGCGWAAVICGADRRRAQKLWMDHGCTAGKEGK